MKAAMAVSVTLNVVLAVAAILLAFMARKLNREILARDREKYRTTC